MTTTENTTAATATNSKVKTVANDMDSRQVFATLAEAEQYLQGCASRFDDWDDQTLVAPALATDEEGNPIGFDPEVYGLDSNEIMVATLKNKGREGEASKMKAIVFAPIPTLDALLATSEGRDFVVEIVRKELNHRAVRQLRVVEDVTTVADQIPSNMGAFLSSSRSDGGILETYNELYKTINTTIGGARGVWRKAKLTKSELRKALESKAYALEYYPALEDGRDGSLFEAAITLGINAAKRSGMDPTIFARWQESRNAKTLTTEEDDEDELDFAALTDAMLSESTEDGTAEPTEEAAA